MPRQTQPCSNSPEDIARELFVQIREKIGTAEQIAEEGTKKLAPAHDLSPSGLRSNFSRLVQETERACYGIYLAREQEAGERVLQAFLANPKGAPVFATLDRLFLSMTQSRRTRAGATFEATIRGLFRRCQYPFQEQCIVNGKPDFLMPSEAHYQKLPTDCIIFTAKRTLRERWRQIATEGTRGKALYLATIDETVSRDQVEEMLANRIYLVLPQELIVCNKVYSSAPNVISFEDFFTDHLDPAVARWKRAGVL